MQALLWITSGAVLYAGMHFLVSALNRWVGDPTISRWGKIMPPATVAVLAGLLFAFPERTARAHAVFLNLHRVAFLLLGVFLAFVGYSLWRIRRTIAHGGSAKAASNYYRRIWIATELFPAATALSILASGARCVWEQPVSNSPTLLPFTVMAVAFGVFFWDGIMGFQPAVRELRTAWETVAGGNEPIDAIARRAARPACLRVLLIHIGSWPLVFAEGLTRWSPPNPLAPPIAWIEHLLSRLPFGWPQALTIVIIWLGAGAVIGLGRLATRKAG